MARASTSVRWEGGLKKVVVVPEATQEGGFLDRIGWWLPAVVLFGLALALIMALLLGTGDSPYSCPVVTRLAGGACTEAGGYPFTTFFLNFATFAAVTVPAGAAMAWLAKDSTPHDSGRNL